jgi:predicted DNA-binding protein
MTEKTNFTFRLTTAEANILWDYAERTGRTQSDILREFIRTLQRKKLKRPDRQLD